MPVWLTGVLAFCAVLTIAVCAVSAQEFGLQIERLVNQKSRVAKLVAGENPSRLGRHRSGDLAGRGRVLGPGW